MVFVQEFYQTGSPAVKQRAKQLRKLGFRVSSSSMGWQVTPLGRIKTTMLTITGPDGKPLPPAPPSEYMVAMRGL